MVQKDNGDHVKLTCNTIGNPSPTISWFFIDNDSSIPREELGILPGLGGDERNCRSRQSGLYFLAQNDPRVLIICHPNYEMHQGKYSCQAKNFLGQDEKTAVVNIESKSLNLSMLNLLYYEVDDSSCSRWTIRHSYVN